MFAFVKTQSMPLVNLNKSLYRFCVVQGRYALEELIIYIKIMICEKRNMQLPTTGRFRYDGSDIVQSLLSFHYLISVVVLTCLPPYETHL